MSWQLFALLCALLLSASSLVEKRVLTKVHSADYSTAVSLISALLVIPFLFLIDFTQVHFLVLVLLFMSSFLATGAFFLVAKGTRHLDISTVAPLLSLTPGLTTIFAFFFLGESIHLYQTIGIMLMMAGSYFLTIEKGISVFASLQNFVKSYYVHVVLVSLLFGSVGALFDRAALHSFLISVPIYMFFLHFFIAVLSVLFSVFFGNGIRGIKKAFETAGTDIFFGSLFTVGYIFFQTRALQLASVGLVSAIKRSSSFFTTIIGGELFHERNLERKITACLIIIAGSILIIF